MNPGLSRHVWLDGRYVPAEEALVPITTHAIHYGTSAFEGIRGYWNGENLHIFRLDDHIRRLRNSGGFYDISLNHTDKEVSDAITGVCKKNGLKESCYIRPFYFVGDYGISLHVTREAPTSLAVFVFPFGDLFARDGITASIVSWRKFSEKSTPTQAKMGGNYLNSIIATQEAKRGGADEAILLDHAGNVSEASGENVFVIKDGRLATPAPESALDGITRDAVIRLASEMGIDASQKEITQDELLAADEVFLTGTAAEITPVTAIDSAKIGDGRPGDITARIKDRYARITMGKDQDYSHWLTAVY